MINATVLSALLKSKLNSKFKQVTDYAGPLAQSNPSYFIAFCDAIATGIVSHTVEAIHFVTTNGFVLGSPGNSNSVFTAVDTDWYTEKLYNEIRSRIISSHGATGHPPWCANPFAVNDPQNPLPPEHCSLHTNQYNPYNFLTALSEGISESVTEHFSIGIQVSTQKTNPNFSGTATVANGGFSGLDADGLKNEIIAAGSSLQGSFWPSICEAIGVSHVAAIQGHTTGTVVV